MKKQSGESLPPSVSEAVKLYALEAEADLERFDGRFLEQFADARDWQSQLTLVESYSVARFDLMAEQLLFTSVSPELVAINPLYEKYLDRAITEKALPYLSVALKPLRDDLRDDFVSRVELKLSARKLRWLAKAKTMLLLRHSTVNETAQKKVALQNPPKAVGNLPPKVSDLSELFAQAQLAPRQAEIASLAWERSMTRAEISRRLGLNWKTVDESLVSAQRRVDIASIKGKAPAKMARHDPEKLTRPPRRFS